MRWRNCGKPHHGLEYDDMNSSRARFKLKFRDCLRNEDNSMKADAIALKLRNKEQGEFWRKVNALNNKKAPLANTVNGCTGSSDIAEMWRKHFMDLFNSVDNSTHKDYVPMLDLPQDPEDDQDGAGNNPGPTVTGKAHGGPSTGPRRRPRWSG